MPGVLPRMTIDDTLGATCIYTVADHLPPEMPFVRVRSFHSPHHSIPHADPVSGVNRLHPGEFILAHWGVLFLSKVPV
jgi:magnesium chelatase family protein